MLALLIGLVARGQARQACLIAIVNMDKIQENGHDEITVEMNSTANSMSITVPPRDYFRFAKNDSLMIYPQVCMPLNISVMMWEIDDCRSGCLDPDDPSDVYVNLNDNDKNGIHTILFKIESKFYLPQIPKFLVEESEVGKAVYYSEKAIRDIMKREEGHYALVFEIKDSPPLPS